VNIYVISRIITESGALAEESKEGKTYRNKDKDKRKQTKKQKKLNTDKS
jgi:hypothetical protein